MLFLCAGSSMGQAGGDRKTKVKVFWHMRLVSNFHWSPISSSHNTSIDHVRNNERLISKYLILQLSQSGIPIWRVWVCMGTRRECRWFQIRALAAPYADCLPAWGRSSGSDESEAWGSACWRERGCAWMEAGRALGLWWSEAPEVSLEGIRRWLCGTHSIMQVCAHPHASTHKVQTHTIDREEEERTNSLFNSRNRGIVHIYSGLLYQDPSFVTHQPSSTC